jgi:hypothetical protein
MSRMPAGLGVASRPDARGAALGRLPARLGGRAGSGRCIASTCPATVASTTCLVLDVGRTDGGLVSRGDRQRIGVQAPMRRAGDVARRHGDGGLGASDIRRTSNARCIDQYQPAPLQCAPAPAARATIAELLRLLALPASARQHRGGGVRHDHAPRRRLGDRGMGCLARRESGLAAQRMGTTDCSGGLSGAVESPAGANAAAGIGAGRLGRARVLASAFRAVAGAAATPSRCRPRLAARRRGLGIGGDPGLAGSVAVIRGH